MTRKDSQDLDKLIKKGAEIIFNAMVKEYQIKLDEYKSKIERDKGETAVICSKICTDFGISEEIFYSRNRSQEVAIIRHIASYILYQKYGYTLYSIGKLLRRHHSTVINSVSEAESIMKYANNFKGVNVSEYVEKFSLENS